MSGRQEPRNAFSVLPGHQYHRQAINLALCGVGVSIKQIVFARRHECNRFGLSLHRDIDHRWSLQVLPEEIRPGLEYVRMDEDNFP